MINIDLSNRQLGQSISTIRYTLETSFFRRAYKRFLQPVSPIITTKGRHAVRAIYFNNTSTLSDASQMPGRVLNRPHVRNSAWKRGFFGRTVTSPQIQKHEIETPRCASRDFQPDLLCSSGRPYPLLDPRAGGEGRNPRISNSIFGTTVRAE